MGGEGKNYYNLKQQHQKKKTERNLSRNLIDPVSLLWIKGYFIWKIIYNDYPLCCYCFFFCTTLCEWESQIVESVIVVFLLSQLKLNWLQEKVTVTYNINLAFLRRAKIFGGPKLEGRLTYLGPRFRLFVAPTSLPEMNDHSHKWIPA